RGRRLFVIFDELFRGTNVKDAYEATIALTSAFAGRTSSFLLLSTHIVEAAEVLRQKNIPIEFIYMPTRVEQMHTVYPYTLKKGVTEDRHGMKIIRDEQIPGILEKGMKEGMPAGNDPVVAGGFTADSQTLEDLNLTGKYKPGSVYTIFDHVQTRGAGQLLEAMFRNPMSDMAAINQRSERFRYAQEKGLSFPFTREQMLAVEDYLQNGAASNRLSAGIQIFRYRVMETAIKDTRYEEIKKGVSAVIAVLIELKKWSQWWMEPIDSPLYPLHSAIISLLKDKRLSRLEEAGRLVAVSWRALAGYHHLFGRLLHSDLNGLCAIIYDLDLIITVARIAKEKDLVYAQALPGDKTIFQASGIRHPALHKAVGNDIRLEKGSHVLFLTGANMAGKSTFMKSVGI
ncbi:MAG: hypothetical protein JST39_05035, partial [Bacteroidetes bacterium]|nr:hypothetical protein [Bacteroidota bacterium]